MGYANRVKFYFTKDAAASYPKEFKELNSMGKLKLITQTRDRFYVFYQPPTAEKALGYGATYDIGKGDVLLALIEVQSVKKVGK